MRTIPEIQADLDKADTEVKRIGMLPSNGATSYVGVPPWLYYRLVFLCDELKEAKKEQEKQNNMAY